MDAIVHCAVFDNAHTRTETARAIIKALVVIGLAAHGLEHLLSGLERFAASADDVCRSRGVFALRGSGFTWRQLARRSRILVPVFLAAVWLCVRVELLLDAGRPGMAGFAFGVSAVALSFTTAVHPSSCTRAAFRELVAEGKIQPGPRRTPYMRLAVRQDFLNPARLGLLFLGALVSPQSPRSCSSASRNGLRMVDLARFGIGGVHRRGLAVAFPAGVERWLFARRVERAVRAPLAG